ncbi:MAG: GMC oxidoreductase, partial [Candidatus Binataceae bacterium]
ILMRSGIGPASVLEPLGIPVRFDAPVGRNLLEHPQLSLVLELMPRARAKDLTARHTNCCVRYSSGLEGTGRNDMIMIAYNLLGGKPTDLAYGHVWVAVYQSFSRGELRIVSHDPERNPEIHFHLLSDPRDLLRMRDAVDRLRQLGSDRAMRSIADRIYLGRKGHPYIQFEPSNPQVRASASKRGISDSSVRDEWMMANCFDVQHAAGTCRMGSDHNAVVDPQCRVIGTEGLRVIDASVMPLMVRANTHLTAVMIGERMAARMRGN